MWERKWLIFNGKERQSLTVRTYRLEYIVQLAHCALFFSSDTCDSSAASKRIYRTRTASPNAWPVNMRFCPYRRAVLHVKYAVSLDDGTRRAKPSTLPI